LPVGRTAGNQPACPTNPGMTPGWRAAPAQGMQKEKQARPTRDRHQCFLKYAEAASGLRLAPFGRAMPSPPSGSAGAAILDEAVSVSAIGSSFCAHASIQCKRPLAGRRLFISYRRASKNFAAYDHGPARRLRNGRPLYTLSARRDHDEAQRHVVLLETIRSSGLGVPRELWMHFNRSVVGSCRRCLRAYRSTRPKCGT